MNLDEEHSDIDVGIRGEGRGGRIALLKCERQPEGIRGTSGEDDGWHSDFEGGGTSHEPHRIVLPCITPDRATKRQNGRRFKEDGEPSFTLTSMDQHGVAIGVPELEINVMNENPAHIQDRVYDERGISATLNGRDYKDPKRIAIEAQAHADGDPEHPGRYVTLPSGVTAYAVWYPKYECYVVIRRLTPLECFRLQGFPDEMFRRAELVNSDTQLYKQAGNSVTVPVIKAIATKMETHNIDS